MQASADSFPIIWIFGSNMVLKNYMKENLEKLLGKDITIKINLNDPTTHIISKTNKNSFFIFTQLLSKDLYKELQNNGAAQFAQLFFYKKAVLLGFLFSGRNELPHILFDKNIFDRIKGKVNFINLDGKIGIYLRGLTENDTLNFDIWELNYPDCKKIERQDKDGEWLLSAGQNTVKYVKKIFNSSNSENTNQKTGQTKVTNSKESNKQQKPIELPFLKKKEKINEKNLLRFYEDLYIKQNNKKIINYLEICLLDGKPKYEVEYLDNILTKSSCDEIFIPSVNCALFYIALELINYQNKKPHMKPFIVTGFVENSSSEQTLYDQMIKGIEMPSELPNCWHSNHQFIKAAGELGFYLGNPSIFKMSEEKLNKDCYIKKEVQLVKLGNSEKNTLLTNKYDNISPQTKAVPFKIIIDCATSCKKNENVINQQSTKQNIINSKFKNNFLEPENLGSSPITGNDLFHINSKKVQNHGHRVNKKIENSNLVNEKTLEKIASSPTAISQQKKIMTQLNQKAGDTSKNTDVEQKLNNPSSINPSKSSNYLKSPNLSERPKSNNNPEINPSKSSNDLNSANPAKRPKSDNNPEINSSKIAKDSDKVNSIQNSNNSTVFQKQVQPNSVKDNKQEIPPNLQQNNFVVGKNQSSNTKTKPETEKKINEIAKPPNYFRDLLINDPSPDPAIEQNLKKGTGHLMSANIDDKQSELTCNNLLSKTNNSSLIYFNNNGKNSSAAQQNKKDFSNNNQVQSKNQNSSNQKKSSPKSADKIDGEEIYDTQEKMMELQLKHQKKTEKVNDTSQVKEKAKSTDEIVDEEIYDTAEKLLALQLGKKYQKETKKNNDIPQVTEKCKSFISVNNVYPDGSQIRKKNNITSNNTVTGFCGIQNFGLTCFLNATLQLIKNMKKLWRAIDPSNSSTNELLKLLMQFVFYDKNQAFNNKNVLEKILCEIDCQRTVNQAGDCGYFINSILLNIKIDPNFYVFENKYQIECEKNKLHRDTVCERHAILRLSKKPHCKNLNEYIENEIKREELCCISCNGKYKRKSITLQLPIYLFVQVHELGFCELDKELRIQDIIYDLIGVSCYTGYHNYAYVKHKESWLKLNDSAMESVFENQVRRDERMFLGLYEKKETI